MVLMASVGVRRRKINYPLIIGLFKIMGGGGGQKSYSIGILFSILA